jgi:hypothetical protein
MADAEYCRCFPRQTAGYVGAAHHDGLICQMLQGVLEGASNVEDLD